MPEDAFVATTEQVVPAVAERVEPVSEQSTLADESA